MAKAFLSKYLHSLIDHAGLPGIDPSGVPSAWSEYAAIADISAAGYTLSATTISAVTYLGLPAGVPSAWSYYPAIADISAAGYTLSADIVSAATYQNLPTDAPSAWSNYAAIANISAMGYTLSASDMYLSGRLGIGTDNPQEELHIKASVPKIRIEDSDQANAYVDLRMAGGDFYVDLDPASAIGGSYKIAVDSNTVFWVGGDGFVGIGTAETTPPVRLTVSGDGSYAASFMSGSVGIGTTTPGAKFQIRAATGTSINHFDINDNVITFIRAGQDASDQKFVSINEDNSDIDFRVEGGGDPLAFFVRGDTGKVGIANDGSDAYAQILNVLGKARIYNTISGADIELYLDSVGDSDGTETGSIIFRTSNDGSSLRDAGKISFIPEAAYGDTLAERDSAMTFSTVLNGVEAEAVRISSLGNLGIGTTSPKSPIQIGSGATQVLNFDGSVAAQLGHNFYYDGSNWKRTLGSYAAAIGFNEGSVGDIAFFNAPSSGEDTVITWDTRMTIKLDGSVSIPGTLSAGTLSATTYQNLPSTIASATSAENADLLDGRDSTDFASGSHLHDYLPLSGGYVSAGTLSADTVSATTYQNLPGGDTSAWSNYAAISDISATGYKISASSGYFAGRLGIGTDSPQDILHLATSNSLDYINIEQYSTGPTLRSSIRFRKSSSNVIGTLVETSANDILGEILFHGVDTTSSFDVGAVITVKQASAAGTRIPSDLHLRTWSQTAENINQLYLHNAGNVGIGTDTPDRRLHIYGGSAGDITGPANTDLIIENDGHAGISIFTPSGYNAIIYFGDGENPQRGWIQYAHPTDIIQFAAAAINRLTIDSTSTSATYIKALTISGATYENLPTDAPSAWSNYSAISNISAIGYTLSADTLFASSGLIDGVDSAAGQRPFQIVGGHNISSRTALSLLNYHSASRNWEICNEAKEFRLFQSSAASGDPYTEGDLRFTIDIAGDARFYNTLSAATISATTYQNLPAGGGDTSAWSTYAAISNISGTGYDLNVDNANVLLNGSYSLDNRSDLGLFGSAYDLSLMAPSRVIIHIDSDNDTASSQGFYVVANQASAGNITNALMMVREDGNVGIGTTNPLDILHLDAVSPNLIIERATKTNEASVKFNTGVIQDWEIGTGLITTDNTLDFYHSSGVGVMVMQSGGNVGIGTTSPSARLHIKAISRQILLQDSTDDYFWFLDSNGTKFYITDGSGNVDRFVITSAGNIGIGTSNPSDMLHLWKGDSSASDISQAMLNLESSGSTNWIHFQNPNTQNAGLSWSDEDVTERAAVYYDHNTDKMHFNAGGSNVLTLVSGGNVGIGNTAPNATLDIEQSGGGMALRLRDTTSNISQKFTPADGFHTYIDSSTTGGNVNFRTSQVTENDTTPLFLQYDGKIGIGTQSPNASYLLHVESPDEEGVLIGHGSMSGAISLISNATLGSVINIRDQYSTSLITISTRTGNGQVKAGTLSATTYQNLPSTIASATSAENADLLDGRDSTDFASGSHTHPGGDITSEVASATSAEYALNSDQLDGQDSTAFADSVHLHNYLPLSGGHVSAGTMSANTVSATTYQNLPAGGGDTSAWSTYEATSDISAAGNSMVFSGWAISYNSGSSALDFAYT